MKAITHVCLLIAVAFCVLISSNAVAKEFYKKPKVQAYIKHVAKKYDFKKSKLDELFSQVTFNNQVIKLITQPYEAKPWYVYRKHLISKRRVREGVAFWKKHQKALQRASKVYGVDPSVIVAIIGIESQYGRNQGGFKVINSLATLAFGYPRRAQFFRRELTQFLLFTRNEKINPMKVKGSYAGAIGQPQFMPSSYRQYAVDFSNSGARDLQNSSIDVIGSVANYLHQHGWQKQQPTVIKAKAENKKYLKLPHRRHKPTLSLERLKRYGITPIKAVSNKHKYLLIVLKGRHKAHIWLGYKNFYVITRYNHSNLYAMAVYQLSQLIKNDYKKSLKKA